MRSEQMLHSGIDQRLFLARTAEMFPVEVKVRVQTHAALEED